MDIIEQTKAKMTAAIEHFKNELKGIRTGRATPGMVEHVMVEVYGTPMRLKDIASISTPEARQLLITPFDPQNTQAINKAIEKANLGFMPAVDGHAVRLRIPPMTQELREKMVKICHEECEKAKISIRNIRREAKETLHKQHKAAGISEDATKKGEEKIQKLTDQFCKEADELSQKKETEISTI